MKNPEEDLDNILGKGLRKRLEGTEAPVNPSLYRDIRKRLEPAGKKTVWYILSLLLVVALFWPEQATVKLLPPIVGEQFRKSFLLTHRTKSGKNP